MPNYILIAPKTLGIFADLGGSNNDFTDEIKLIDCFSLGPQSDRFYGNHTVKRIRTQHFST